MHKVSFVHGICVERDAISNAIQSEIRWLQESGLYDVAFFTNHTDFESLRVRKVSGPGEVAFDDHFQASDLVVFHFGIYYPLFNLLPVVPIAAKSVVVFHNVTPREFAPEGHRSGIELSFRQMSNIAFADHVVCDSGTNLEVLRAALIDTPATVLPLAVDVVRDIPTRKPSMADGVVRVAFVGRLVRSKGPTELLEAIRNVLEDDSSFRIRVDLVGNLAFSDGEVVSEIRDRAENINKEFDGRGRVEFPWRCQRNRKVAALG